MKQDFEKIERNINIGAGFFFIVAITLLTLTGLTILKLENEIDTLEEEIIQKDKDILVQNKELYRRFVIASDLTTICDRFKSSKEAKEKYYIYGTL